MRFFKTNPFPVIFAAAIIGALVFRLTLFWFALDRLPVSSDEAWPGLMAFNVLKGEFPVFYWGQNYMGAQECYIEALFFKLFGANKFALRLLPLIVALLFLPVCYQLACRVYNREVALFTMVLLVVPTPYLAMCGTMIPPPNYLTIALLGALSLILTHRIAFGERPPGWRCFVALGAVLGYGLWLHLVMLAFIGVAVLFLFLNDKLLVLRRNFWLLVAAFLFCGLPFWVHNWQSGFATFRDVGVQSDWPRTWAYLKTGLTYTAQFPVGLRVMLYGDSAHNIKLPVCLFYPLAALWIGALGLVIVANWRRFRSLFYLSLRNVDGTAMLLALAAAVFLMFARSARAGANDARFIAPALAVLPVLLAFGLWRLSRWSRWLTYLALGFVVFCQAWGNVLLARAWNEPELVAVKLELPDSKPLLDFLASKNIRHAYAHNWLSYRLTYETQERLIVSEPFNQRFPGQPVQYLDLVGAADRVAYITHPTLGIKPAVFESLLDGAGGSRQKTNLACFTVFYDFCPPCGNVALRELARVGWRIKSASQPENVERIIDGDLRSAWSSASAQTPGMSIELDLGATQTVCVLRFDLGDYTGDHPRGLRIEVSEDDADWKTVLESGDLAGGIYWDNAQPRFLVRGREFTCSFAPVAVRYLRIIQTGAHHRAWWSIAELRVFGPQ